MPLPGFCAVSQLTAPSLIIIYHIRTRSLSSPGVGGPKLYRRRVKHDADGSTEGLGGQVRPELGADNARVAVGPGDLAPDDADLGALDGALGAVDVCYALTGVPLCGGGVVNTLELEEGGAGVGVALSSLVGNVLALDVETVRLVVRHGE